MKLFLSAIFAASVILSTLAAWRPANAPGDSTVAAVVRPDMSQTDPLIPPVPLDVPSGSWPMSTDFSHDVTASFHGHGDRICASGCSLSRHPTDKLTKRRFMQLLKQCASAELNADNIAFETLLYFGRQTTSMISSYGTPCLSHEESSILLHELSRQHVRVSIRVVDQRGQQRSWVDEVRVPLDRRHVFEMKTNRLPPPLVTSGTVKRVGQDHLWTRL